MGLFDFLKPKSALEKAAQQVKEAYAQPDYRRGAMDKLFEIGSEEAYWALLQRFTYNANGQIADESEKNDLVARLVEHGEQALPVLQRFIKTEKKLDYPIQALLGIMGKEEGLTFLTEALQQYEPLDHRSTLAKTTLVLSLAELVDPEQAEIFVPYLADHHDDVQFQSIVAIERCANPDTAEALMALCAAGEFSPRVQRRAAQALVKLAWPVKQAYEGFDPELKSEYQLTKKGLLEKKAAKS